MPDDHRVLSHVSLRVPSDLIEAFDRLAAALDRPRSWVMVRALRQYLESEPDAALLMNQVYELPPATPEFIQERGGEAE